MSTASGLAAGVILLGLVLCLCKPRRQEDATDTGMALAADEEEGEEEEDREEGVEMVPARDVKPTRKGKGKSSRARNGGAKQHGEQQAEDCSPRQARAPLLVAEGMD